MAHLAFSHDKDIGSLSFRIIDFDEGFVGDFLDYILLSHLDFYFTFLVVLVDDDVNNSSG